MVPDRRAGRRHCTTPRRLATLRSHQEGDVPLPHTACRETQEETGLIAQPEQLTDWQLTNRYEIFPEWRHRYPDGITHNSEHVYSLCVPGTLAITTQPTEHLSYRWLPWQTAAQQVFSWSNRDAILMLSHATHYDPAF